MRLPERAGRASLRVRRRSQWLHNRHRKKIGRTITGPLECASGGNERHDLYDGAERAIHTFEGRARFKAIICSEKEGLVRFESDLALLDPTLTKEAEKEWADLKNKREAIRIENKRKIEDGDVL